MLINMKLSLMAARCRYVASKCSLSERLNQVHVGNISEFSYSFCHLVTRNVC